MILHLGLSLMLTVAQQNFDTVQVRTIKAGEGVYMLTGLGGNIGVSSGPDGVMPRSPTRSGPRSRRSIRAQSGSC